MTRFNFNLLALPFSSVYEGEDDSSDSGVSVTSDSDTVTSAAAATTGSASGEARFTQEQLNRLLAEDKRKHQEQLKKTIAEIDALKARSGLTEKERDDLERRLETVRNEAMTKEQVAKKKQMELQQDYESRIKDLESKKKEWEDRYINTTIQRSLVDAAAKNKAYSPEQIVYILKDNTRLVEEFTEDGKPTGEYVAKVKLQDVSPEGKPVILEFSTEEAVARMKEFDKYKNLFQAEGSGGLGLLSNPPSRKADLATLASDPEAYRKARKDGTVSF